MAVIWVSLLMVTLVAAFVPNEMLVGQMKLEPVMVTLVPPVAGPLGGLIAVTIGGGGYVNRSAGLVAEVPPGVVTVTSTMLLALPGGLMAVIWVLLTDIIVAAFVPKKTSADSVKLEP